MWNTSEEDIGICIWWDNGASMPKMYIKTADLPLNYENMYSYIYEYS